MGKSIIMSAVADQLEVLNEAEANNQLNEHLYYQKKVLEAYSKKEINFSTKDLKIILTNGLEDAMIPKSIVQILEGGCMTTPIMEELVRKSLHLQQRLEQSNEEIWGLKKLLRKQAEIIKRAGDEADHWQEEAGRYKRMATGTGYEDEILDFALESPLNSVKPPKKTRDRKMTVKVAEQIVFLKNNRKMPPDEAMKELGLSKVSYRNRMRQIRELNLEELLKDQREKELNYDR